ncbi:MAG TPA: hypothetical protein VET23_10570 [Chitinophagaceae bacterium]|nr:hypothetical protein [Chitinophagaceae bacterium]
MKNLLLFSSIALISLSFRSPHHFFNTNSHSMSDSGIINHVPDGCTSEWPDEKFETNKGTNIKYTVDNDAVKLFVAIIILTSGCK